MVNLARSPWEWKWFWYRGYLQTRQNSGALISREVLRSEDTSACKRGIPYRLFYFKLYYYDSQESYFSFTWLFCWQRFGFQQRSLPLLVVGEVKSHSHISKIDRSLLISDFYYVLFIFPSKVCYLALCPGEWTPSHGDS